MRGTILVQYTDDDRNLAVMDPQRGRGYKLVLEASDGLEVTIPFDEVNVGRNDVTLYRTRPTGARVETASFEHHLEAWGGVGDWLLKHAAMEAPR